MSSLADTFKRELNELGRYPDSSVIHALTMVANDAADNKIGLMSILHVIEAQLKQVRAKHDLYAQFSGRQLCV